MKSSQGKTGGRRKLRGAARGQRMCRLGCGPFTPKKLRGHSRRVVCYKHPESRQRIWQMIREREGRCEICGKPSQGKARCAECGEKKKS